VQTTKKRIPLETIPEMGVEWGIKENGGGGKFRIIYLMYCKNLCRCHNVPLPTTTIKIKNK
jgi:hypothetical protein